MSETLGGMRALNPKPGYDSGDEALNEFYVPALSRAKSYDRSVGYFRASSLSVAARGMSRFIASGGNVRLLVGAELTEADATALAGKTKIPSSLADKLAASLVVDTDEIARQRLAVLAWLAQQGRLAVRVVVALDADEQPVVGDDVPYFHEKIGVLRDEDGDGLAFQGSVNESARAWSRNFESFSVFTSWGTPKHFDTWASKFEQRWAGQVPRFRVFELPDAVTKNLLTYAPATAPPARDPEEPSSSADDAVVARFLELAPRFPRSQNLALETTGLQPFPHQLQVVERLAGTYPRSWLLADEVGLGKTISAGLALRRLLLSKRVRRVLIMAPANVAKQWQDELFEKFAIWVPRLDKGRILGVHHEDVELLPEEGNPYDDHPVLIVSSHLARRARHRELIRAAARFDLVICDEAHHARRQGFQDPSRYRPSLLLQLLDEMRESAKAKATWLLTATPMQVNPIELRDLLAQVGLTGSLSRWPDFRFFYSELAKSDSESPNWGALTRLMKATPLPAPGAVEQVLLERIASKLGPVARSRIESFATAGNPEEVAQQLGPAGRAELREWLRLRSPVGQFVTRHSRNTLRRYRDQGLLSEPIAERAVTDVSIAFSDEERELYERLDDLIDRLLQAHGTQRHAGFVLTIYRKRLTSSWAAIRRTLHRRLARTADLAAQLELDADVMEELDDGDLETVDEQQSVPLSNEDIEEIRSYLAQVDQVGDSKFDRLLIDLEEARSEGRSAIVFTQFTDTLNSLRDRLSGKYRDELATFTGEGGRRFDSDTWDWYSVSKQELVSAIEDKRCTVVLANDAASEGLNLQAASFLVNFDLPWNPMRVEQRIGRIDRIGQPTPVIKVRNYTIPGTIETDIQAALRDRIGDFHALVGRLQPILGATERTITEAYKARHTNRSAVVDEAKGKLLGQLDELESSGIELVDEDLLPPPKHPAAPVNLGDLRTRLPEIGIEVAGQGRPVTFDPERTSRDETDWTALASYGHPLVEEGIEKIARAIPDEHEVVFSERDHLAEAVRADRTPPEPILRITELDELGPSVSNTQAIALVEELLGAARQRESSMEQAVSALQKTAGHSAIRERFIEIIREVVAATTANRELTSASEIDPAEIYFELKDDRTTYLGYTDKFRERLDLPLRKLLPSRAEINRFKNQPPSTRIAAMNGGNAAMTDLIKEFIGQGA